MWHGDGVDSPLTAASPRLRPPAHRVSPRAIRYWAARALIGWLVLIAAQVFLVVVTPGGLRSGQVALLAATVVAAAAHLAVMPQWRDPGPPPGAAHSAGFTP